MVVPATFMCRWCPEGPWDPQDDRIVGLGCVLLPAPATRSPMRLPRFSIPRLTPRVRRVLPAVLLAVGLVVATVGPVLGHALYVRSDPRSGGQLQTPGTVRVWFT